jgi:AI-2 transport protein TqsA
VPSDPIDNSLLCAKQYQEKRIMQTMTLRGCPVLRSLLAAAAIVIVVFGVLMVIILTLSVKQLSLRLPFYQELLHRRIDTLGTALGNIGIDLQDTLNSFVTNSSIALAKTAINVTLGALGNSISIVFFLFLLFLMLVESKSIATKFQTSLQTGNNFVLQLGTYTKQIQTQYRIQAMSNLLSAVAITVELALFRVDFVVLWGFLTFILGFIPNVGLIIACLPAIMIAFILYGWATALAVLAIGIALNAAMDNVVTPRIMGKGLNMSVLLVFLSFLFWSWVFGFIGALLAIPATLFVKTLFQGRQETRFLVVLLSGEVDSDTTVAVPHEGRDESGTAKGDQSDTPTL